MGTMLGTQQTSQQVRLMSARHGQDLMVINLDNVTVIKVDPDGAYGGGRRVTVHLAGGECFHFDDEDAAEFLSALESRTGFVTPER